MFGILKRVGKVYTKVVGDTKSETLMPLITRKITPDSVVYTDCYRSYNTLDVNPSTMNGLITPRYLHRVKITLMGLRTSGI